MRHVFAAVMLLVAVPACKKASTATSADKIKVAAYCERLAWAACNWTTRCRAARAAMSEDDCFDTMTQACNRSADRLAKGVAAGRMTYDENKAAACLTLYVAGACNLTDLDDVCDEVFKPTVAGGGDCFHDDECVSGTCQLDTCPGKCMTKGQVGDTCGFPTPACDETVAACDFFTAKCVALGTSGPCGYGCAPGYYCHFTNGSQQCEARGAAGAACTSRAACAEKLACLNNVCTGPGPTGAPCDIDARCQDGLLCLSNATTGSRSCGPPRTRGETCRDPGECLIGLTCRRLTDNAAAVCEPFVPAGGACNTWSASAPSADCELGYYCSGGICAPRPGDGAACRLSGSSGAYCFGENLTCETGSFSSTGVCRAPPGYGAPCVPTGLPDECADGFYCDNATDRCAARLEVGGNCMDSNECVSGLCVFGTPNACAAVCNP